MFVFDVGFEGLKYEVLREMEIPLSLQKRSSFHLWALLPDELDGASGPADLLSCGDRPAS